MVNADENKPATKLAKFLKSLEFLSSRATNVSRTLSTGRLSVADDEEGSRENSCLTALLVSYTSADTPGKAEQTYLEQIKSIIRLIVSLQDQESK